MSPDRPRLILLCLAATLTSAAGAVAQERHFPLDHRQPTGVAGRWSVLTAPSRQARPQPVKISVEGDGQIEFFSGSPHSPVAMDAPAQAGMIVGHTYRIRVSNMEAFPGVEIYPTIELLDRLHPPEGLADEFPIPVEITAKEIETVLQDRMITKVIYLEEPDLAIPKTQTNGIHTESLPPSMNLLEAADMRGRPMAILRIGGRIPNPHAVTDEFYSQSPLVLAPSQRLPQSSPAGR